MARWFSSRSSGTDCAIGRPKDSRSSSRGRSLHFSSWPCPSTLVLMRSQRAPCIAWRLTAGPLSTHETPDPRTSLPPAGAMSRRTVALLRGRSRGEGSRRMLPTQAEHAACADRVASPLLLSASRPASVSLPLSAPPLVLLPAALHRLVAPSRPPKTRRPQNCARQTDSAASLRA